MEETLLNLQLAYRIQSHSSLIIIELVEQSAVPLQVKDSLFSTWYNLAASSNDKDIALNNYLNSILRVNNLLLLSQCFLHLVIALFTMFIAFVL